MASTGAVRGCFAVDGKDSAIPSRLALWALHGGAQCPSFAPWLSVLLGTLREPKKCNSRHFALSRISCFLVQEAQRSILLTGFVGMVQSKSGGVSESSILVSAASVDWRCSALAARSSSRWELSSSLRPTFWGSIRTDEIWGG